MFERILVGVDGHEGGRDAIALAKQLVSESGRITLAHIYPGEPYVWRGGNPAYWPLEEEEVVAMLEAARSQANIDADFRYSPVPPVGRRLHELAEDVAADLLVVGSSRRGLWGRVMLGDDMRGALNGAPCAVAVAPAGYVDAPHPIHAVGVGYDGSFQSAHALTTARRLASELGAGLSAFQVVTVPARVYMGAGAPDAMSVDVLADRARARIADLGGVEPHAVYGDPADELARFAASVDLLVVGSRDYGPVGRLIHGSTSGELARRCRCPLLVLTRAARGADAVKVMTRMAEAAASRAQRRQSL
jgi:nucleotide-binding universal stress UspA family protein